MSGKRQVQLRYNFGFVQHGGEMIHLPPREGYLSLVKAAAAHDSTQVRLSPFRLFFIPICFEAVIAAD
jgi:hypothetical protein